MLNSKIATLALGALPILLTAPLQAGIYNVYSSANGTPDEPGDQVSIASSYYQTPSSSVTNVTAIYANRDITWGSAGLSSGSTGSGVYTDLFRIQNNGSEQGYNSTNLQYDQKNGVGIPVLQLKNASVVNYNGTYYFEFLFDGNETDNAVSLDQFLFFTSPNAINTATASSTPTQAEVVSFFENSTNQGKLRYSLDSLDATGTELSSGTNNSVLFFASGGSGHGDEGIYIPVSTVLGNGGSLNDYIYIWAKMGTTGTYNVGTTGSPNNVNFGSTGGFEEFAYFRGDQGATTYGSTVPETDGVLGGCLLVGFVLVYRRRASVPLTH